jgi:hypothetical protein
MTDSCKTETHPKLAPLLAEGRNFGQIFRGFLGQKSIFFLSKEKPIVPLIATPNVDSANRRQTRKAKELGYML